MAADYSGRYGRVQRALGRRAVNGGFDESHQSPDVQNIWLTETL
jgi:hypothetical protein